MVFGVVFASKVPRLLRVVRSRLARCRGSQSNQHFSVLSSASGFSGLGLCRVRLAIGWVGFCRIGFFKGWALQDSVFRISRCSMSSSSAEWCCRRLCVNVGA